MALYLIRHPAPRLAPGFCYGRSDVPLAADPGDLCAGLLHRLPASFELYSSPRRRCLELARALQAPVRVDERLAEMDFGRWEMQAWNDIGPAALDAWIASGYDNDQHGGESLTALSERVLDWLYSLDPDDEVVAVTHAGVIRLLLGHVHGWSVDLSLRLPLDFAGITCVQQPRQRREIP